MDVVLKHPDYKSVMSAHGSEWAQYNDMKPVCGHSEAVRIR